MNLEFSKDTVLYQKKVCDITFMHEQTQEAIVPDALPDIYEILCTYANICLRGKDTSSGRVVVSGTAETSVLFSAENGDRVRSLCVSLPFTVSADAEEITDDSAVIADISILSAESKMINPRKVLVKVNLNVSLRCYNTAQLCVSCRTPEENGIEVLFDKAEADTVRNVTEKTFIISDEYSISGSKAAVGEILASTSRLYTEDVKPIGSKLIVSGRVGSKVVYLAEAGESVECAEFSTMFSQIVELPEPADENSCNIELMLTGAYCNVSSMSGMKGIAVEIHAVAQCETSCPTEINYIADIFSTKNILDCGKSTLDISKTTENTLHNEILRGTIPIEAAAERILNSDFTACVASVNEKDGGVEAMIRASASILYTSQNGIIKSAKGIIEGISVIPNCKLDSCSIGCRTGDEIYVTPSGMELEVRIPVTLCVKGYTNCTVSFVESAGCSEEPADDKDRPSVILYNTRESDDMWSISKRFRTSRRLIEEANMLEGCDDLKSGTLLLIPKSR